MSCERRRWFAVSAALLLLLAATVAGGQPPAEPPTESALIAILRSDAPEADKAITCKQLAIYGTSAAVGDLATLLDNPRLSSWARIGLEAIGGAEADVALRTAAGRLTGRQLVGVINSLGVRRDAAAIPMLAGKLTDADLDVATAAAAALGRIATPEAAAALTAALATAASPAAKDAVAEAAVVCAERLVAAGARDQAVALYDLVRRSEVSEQRRAEAIRGAILVRGVEGIPLLVETLRSPSRRLANMGLFTARELGRGDRPDMAVQTAVDAALIAEVAAARSGSADVVERGALVLDVLAERNAGQGRADVQKALVDTAAAGPKPLRLAAVRALGRTGNVAAVEPLLAVASDADPGFALVVREAVAMLPGADVDRAIVGRLAAADPRLLATLVGLVGDRRIAAVADVLPLVQHADPAVRSAAIATLGSIVDLANLDVLVKLALAAPSGDEGAPTRAALREASVRMPDREACAEKLAAALATATGEQKVLLLDVLGAVGGGRSLAAVAAAGKSGDPALQDAATRLLGTWMTADAAPVLLDLAGMEGGGKYATRALRGYLRIARQFTLPDAERVEMCRRALAVAKEEVDLVGVLEILSRYPTAAGLAVAEEVGKRPGLEAKAKAAADAIRGKLPK